MIDYINDSYKVSVSDIFRQIIKKWWLVLLVAFALSSVCMGYKYFTFVPETSITSVENGMANNEAIESYSVGQTNMSNEIQNLYDKADRMANYTQSSIYYNLDPTAFAVSIANFELSTSEGSEIEPVYNSYLYSVTNGAYVSELAEELSLSEACVRETIRVIAMDSAVLNSDLDKKSCSFIVCVYGENYDYTNYVLDRIIDEMPSITDRISSSITHQCVFLTRNQAIKSEYTIRADQSSVDSYIVDTYARINNVSNYMKNIPEPSSNSESTQSTLSIKTVLKYGIIGAVLGVIIASCAITILYLFDGRILDKTRFLNRYNVVMLGKSDAMIIANLKNYLANKSDVVFTGSASDEIIKNKVETIKSEITDIKITEAPDILGNAKSRVKLIDSKNIVLVEELKQSKFADIDEELMVLSSMEKNVIGVILI